MHPILSVTMLFIWTCQVEAMLGKWHPVIDNDCSYTHYRQPIRNAVANFEFVIERTDDYFIPDTLRKDLLKFAFRKNCAYQGIAIFRSGKFPATETNAYMFATFEAGLLIDEVTEGDVQNPENVGKLVVKILAYGVLNQEDDTLQYQPLDVVEKGSRNFEANWALPVDPSSAPPEGEESATPATPAQSASNPREMFAKLRSNSQKFLQRTNSQIAKAKGLFQKGRTMSHAILNTESTSKE